MTYDWYQAFLDLLLVTNSELWFGKLVAMGELAIGLGLILGAFVGVAAFFGGLMSWSFLMAGTVSTNPIMFAVTGLLILAWKTTGYYGLDRYLLPLVGTPWQRRDPGENHRLGHIREAGHDAPKGHSVSNDSPSAWLLTPDAIDGADFFSDRHDSAEEFARMTIEPDGRRPQEPSTAQEFDNGASTI